MTFRFIFFIAFLLIIQPVYGQEVVLEKKLETRNTIPGNQTYNSLNEPNLAYFYFPEKGYLRREKNTIEFFDLNFTRKWNLDFASLNGLENGTNFYRLVHVNDYLFIAVFAKAGDSVKEFVQVSKISLADGSQESVKPNPDLAIRSIDYMIYRDAKLYLFCNDNFYNDLWGMVDHFYSSVVVYDENLQFLTKHELPDQISENKAKINWMFLHADETGFSYACYYCLKDEKASNCEMNGPGLHEEVRLYDYDFNLVNQNIEKKYRPEFYPNPIKYDTTRYAVVMNGSVKNTILTKRIVSHSSQVDNADVPYLPYYPIISGIGAKNKIGGSGNATLMAEFNALLGEDGRYPQHYLRYVDAIEDPINKSLSIAFIIKNQVKKLYIATLNSQMKISSIHLFKLASVCRLGEQDYNFSMDLAKYGGTLQGTGDPATKNAFDYIAEHGAGKICSVVNKADSQVVFLDDPETGEIAVVEVK